MVARAKSAAAEEILRFESRSGRLSPGTRPDPAVTSAGQAPTLSVRVISGRAGDGTETVISALVVDGHGRALKPASMVAVLVGDGVPVSPERPMYPVDGGVGYELRLRTEERLQTFGWAVRAIGNLGGKLFDRVASGAFQAAGGRIDASAARVEGQGDDVEVTVPAEIETPGAYWLYGELWGGPGGIRPIAFARQQIEGLVSGSCTLSLSFAASIIGRRAADVPYVVRNLRLQRADD